MVSPNVLEHGYEPPIHCDQPEIRKRCGNDPEHLGSNRPGGVPGFRLILGMHHIVSDETSLPNTAFPHCSKVNPSRCRSACSPASPPVSCATLTLFWHGTVTHLPHIHSHRFIRVADMAWGDAEHSTQQDSPPGM